MNCAPYRVYIACVRVSRVGPLESNKNALVPRDESAHSRGTTPLGSLRDFVLTMEPAYSTDGAYCQQARSAAPLTLGLRSPLLGQWPVQGSAQERTSAGFARIGLSVYGPISLADSPRLLFSVTAFTFSTRGPKETTEYS